MTPSGQTQHAPEPPTGRSQRAAFSLVELVIVVVIVGIIAAIAVPRFSRAAASATQVYVNSSVSTVQRGIELYYAEHGKYPGYNPGTGAPDGAWFTSQLLEFSNDAGSTQAAFGSPYIYGPYLRLPFPTNPFNELDTVTVVANPSVAVAAGSCGWVAVLSTGDFGINATVVQLDDFNLDSQRVGSKPVLGF